jgi:hypothetical protein
MAAECLTASFTGRETIVAFNNVGHYFLVNGASTWITIRFNPHGVGEDHGAQWIMADPKSFDTFPTPSGTTQLESSRAQKRVVYQNGGTDWSYNCLVENTASPGWLPTWFSLTGGGNA